MIDQYEFITKTGWIPSPEKKPNEKPDWPLAALKLGITETPTQASNETFVSRVDDQLDKPWCVAFSVVDAIIAKRLMMGLPIPTNGFSKPWLYAMCKKYDGASNQDGTYIRTALWVAQTYGLCPDELCPTDYWLTQSSLPTITSTMMNEAAKYKIVSYARIQNSEGYVDLNGCEQALASGNFVIIGSWVEQDNWLNGDDLILEPKGYVLGGHCTHLFGYNKTEQAMGYTGFKDGLNSWSKTWGNQGKYRMADSYIQWKTVDTGQPAVQEAWTFLVGGEVTKTHTTMTVPMQIVQTSAGGHTMLPFRSVYEALGANVWYYFNHNNKLVAVAEIALKDKTVVVEAIQDSTQLNIYE